MPDRDGVGFAEEGDDDPLEGLEGRPGVHFGVRVDGLPDFGESGGLEDLGREEVLGVLAGGHGWIAEAPTVIIKVFEGGEGSTSGGRSERSRESGDLLPDDARERDGDGMVTCMFAVAIICVLCAVTKVLCESLW